MNAKDPTRRFLPGLVLLLLISGLFWGCAKRAEVPPGPEEVEVVTPREAQPTPVPPPGGEQEGVVSEESIQAEARSQLQSLLEDIHFDFDKYNIRPDAREILKKDYQILRRAPGVEVLVEGHCDERGTVEYNLALGQKRAEATRDFLISLGFPADQISTISYGEEMPIDPRHNEEAWAKNRRAHLVILKR